MLYRAKRPQVKNIPESQSVPQKASSGSTFAAIPTLRSRWKSSAISSVRHAAIRRIVEELLQEYDSRLRSFSGIFRFRA